MSAAVRLSGCAERACLLTQANGKTPYPHKFHLTTNFPDFIDKYTNAVQLKDGESDQSASVSLAGRVWSIRNSGKLCFMDLHSDGMKLQVMAQADVLTSGPMPFDDLIATVRRGDIIGVTGTFDTDIPAARCSCVQLVIPACLCVSVVQARRRVPSVENSRFTLLLPNSFPRASTCYPQKSQASRTARQGFASGASHLALRRCHGQPYSPRVATLGSAVCLSSVRL